MSRSIRLTALAAKRVEAMIRTKNAINCRDKSMGRNQYEWLVAMNGEVVARRIGNSNRWHRLFTVRADPKPARSETKGG